MLSEARYFMQSPVVRWHPGALVLPASLVMALPTALAFLVVVSAFYSDSGELGGRTEFEARAGHRVWKLRLYDLIEAHYLKTPLRERQWFNVLDLAAECARIPGTTEIDNEKRGRMVDSLCRAINRGEFKDAKGRMQVANLHPSPHVSIRLALKWLDFDQLVAFAKQGFLFIRRKESIECFAQNNIDFPTAWLPSELAGPDVPNTRSLPAAQTAPDQRSKDRAGPDSLKFGAGPPPAVQRRQPKVSKPESGTSRKPSSAMEVPDAAIKTRLVKGDRPGSTGPWKKFYEAISTDCDAFKGDPKNQKYKRGFSDDTIEVVTRELMKSLPR